MSERHKELLFLICSLICSLSFALSHFFSLIHSSSFSNFCTSASAFVSCALQ